MNVSIREYYNNYKTLYHSPSQLIRNITESWFSDNMYCPFCLTPSIEAFSNNHAVSDYYCSICSEEFQLKSKKNKFGNIITDGEYNKMIEAIYSQSTPNFFFLNYSANIEYINNLILVPKEFIVPSVIHKRKPLSIHAMRSGWTGCNIAIGSIPDKGKIYTIKDSKPIEKSLVKSNIISIDFLRKIKDVDSRGWLNDILFIVSEIKPEFFTLDDVYKFVPILKKLHPTNNNIEAKIRQQLQVLRDNTVIEFIERGLYKKIVS
ncbi:MAG: DpnI domain-containing protein [Clostridiaceae bacterium]